MTDGDKQAEDHKKPLHHEASNSFQKRFIRHVSDLVKSILVDGNPFDEDDLQTAENHKMIMPVSAERSVFEAYTTGQDNTRSTSKNGCCTDIRVSEKHYLKLI